MPELELRFQIPATSMPLLEAEMKQAGARRQHLQTHYFDTADGTLAHCGIALRLRKAGRRWEQTLKAGGIGGIEPLERHTASVPSAGPDRPALDLARHADSAALKALENALTHAHAGAELIEYCRADIWRRALQLRESNALIELAFDQGSIHADGRETAVGELKMTLKSGETAVLITAAQRRAARYNLWLNTISKAERGERLARNEAQAPPTRARPLHLKQSLSADAALRAIVRNCLEQILANDVEVIAGGEIDEHIHQLRVGLRRLRTALRELGEYADAIDPGWESILSRVFGQLGEYRDRATVLSGAQHRLAAANAPLVELQLTGGATPQPVEVVLASDFQQLLIQLIGFCLRQPPSAGVKVKRAFRSRLSRLEKKIERASQRFATLSPEAQHRVRKQIKRLRYLSDFAVALFPRAKTDRYLADLRPAQDALGLLQDDAVALEFYRAAVAQDARAWFAVGWLTAQSDANIENCRHALVRLADTPQFWKKNPLS